MDSISLHNGKSQPYCSYKIVLGKKKCKQNNKATIISVIKIKWRYYDMRKYLHSHFHPVCIVRHSAVLSATIKQLRPTKTKTTLAKTCLSTIFMSKNLIYITSDYSQIRHQVSIQEHKKKQIKKQAELSNPRHPAFLIEHIK